MGHVKNYQENEKVQKYRWLILVAIGLFTFMATLDGSIVNIALPTIAKDVNVPMNQSEWVVSIYLMVVCACLLLFGKVGDSIGKIKVFKIGTFVFVVGSLLCGMTHSLEFLLFARIVQAVGASMTMSTNNGIITEVFPMHERGKALGLIGSFVSLGSIAGPGVGGIILAKFSWSYIFLINVPVGLLTILLGMYCLPKDISKSGKSIDYVGFATFAVFIMTLFGGIFLGQEYGFTKAPILALLVAALISLVVFVIVENKIANPLVTFAIFKNKLFTISLISAALIFAANFFMNVIMPFYLQPLKGYSASFAGMLMMVFPIAMVVASPISGAITDRFGPKWLTIVGLLTLTISQFCYTFLTKETSLVFLVTILALMGLGNALFQAPNNTVIMSSVAKENLGVAGSMNALARNFGMVVGISLSTTVLYGSMSRHYGSKVTTFLPERPDVFVYGMHVTFLVAFVICLVATLLILYRTIKQKKNQIN